MELPAIVAILATAAGVAFAVWRRFIQDRRPRFPVKPGQDAVIDLLWHEWFGVKRLWWAPWKNRPPAVEWIEGDRLQPMGDGRWAWEISYDPDGRGPLPEQRLHVQGLAFPERGFVQVAWFPNTTSFAGTALAHELWHCYLHLTRGDGNPEHTDPGFDDIVIRCNEGLRKLGR